MEVGILGVSTALGLLGVGALFGVSVMALRFIEAAIAKVISFLVAIMTALFWVLLAGGAVLVLAQGL